MHGVVSVSTRATLRNRALRTRITHCRSSQCGRSDLGGLGLCGANVALDSVCGAFGDLSVGRVGCILDGVGGILQAQCWEACADGGDTVAELGRGCGRGDLESGSGGGEDGAGDAREDVGDVLGALLYMRRVN